MLLIPAIDLKDGQCVRLRQGDMKDVTVFSDDITAVAERWVKAYAKRLHMVDLNGAFEGKPINSTAIRQVHQAYPKLPIQVGGGIRSLKTIETYLNSGVSYCIIGTKAVHKPLFVKEACQNFPGKIIVGLDAKNGFVAIDGWETITKHQVQIMAQQFEDYGIESIIYTDIGRDGMMKGVNIKATRDLANVVNIPIIASGGITNMEDIEALSTIEKNGVIGAITGRAIYEGTLDFKKAQQLSNKLSA